MSRWSGWPFTAAFSFKGFSTAVSSGVLLVGRGTTEMARGDSSGGRQSSESTNAVAQPRSAMMDGTDGSEGIDESQKSWGISTGGVQRRRQMDVMTGQNEGGCGGGGGDDGGDGVDGGG